MGWEGKVISLPSSGPRGFHGTHWSQKNFSSPVSCIVIFLSICWQNSPKKTVSSVFQSPSKIFSRHLVLVFFSCKDDILHIILNIFFVMDLNRNIAKYTLRKPCVRLGGKSLRKVGGFHPLFGSENVSENNGLTLFYCEFIFCKQKPCLSTDNFGTEYTVSPQSFGLCYPPVTPKRWGRWGPTTRIFVLPIKETLYTWPKNPFRQYLLQMWMNSTKQRAGHETCKDRNNSDCAPN